jgi:hypothetical protein
MGVNVVYPHRIVVCIDVYAGSLSEAYGKVYEAMGSLPKGMEWESSDESFDDQGNMNTPEALQDARMKYMAQRANDGS